MNRFLRYDEEFQNSIRILSRSLSRMNEIIDMGELMITSINMEEELSETEGYLTALSVEGEHIKLLPNTYDDKTIDITRIIKKSKERKEEYNNMLKFYEETLAHSQAKILRLHRSPLPAHDDVNAGIASVNTNGDGTSSSSTMKKIEKSTFELESAQNIIAETEAIGDSTLNTLQQQKDILTTADENTLSAVDVALRARHLLKMMENRAFRHKLCIFILIIVLLGINISLIVLLSKQNEDK